MQNVGAASSSFVMSTRHDSHCGQVASAVHVVGRTLVWQILESIGDKAPVEASNAVPLHDLLRHGPRLQRSCALQLDLPPADVATSGLRFRVGYQRALQLA